MESAEKIMAEIAPSGPIEWAQELSMPSIIEENNRNIKPTTIILIFLGGATLVGAIIYLVIMHKKKASVNEQLSKQS